MYGMALGHMKLPVKMLPVSRTKAGWLVGVLTTRLSRGRVPKLTSDYLHASTHETERRDHGFSTVSAGHIILTPIQPVGSGRPQWESNNS